MSKRPVLNRDEIMELLDNYNSNEKKVDENLLVKVGDYLKGEVKNVYTYKVEMLVPDVRLVVCQSCNIESESLGTYKIKGHIDMKKITHIARMTTENYDQLQKFIGQSLGLCMYTYSLVDKNSPEINFSFTNKIHMKMDDNDDEETHYDLIDSSTKTEDISTSCYLLSVKKL